MTDGFYTWGDFKNEVLGLMPLDKDRLIQGDDGQFLTRLIKLAAIDLQRNVRVYTLNQEEDMQPSDFTADGYASVGTLPAGARVREVWLLETQTDYSSSTENSGDSGEGATTKVVWYPVRETSWDARHALANNAMGINDNNGRIALSPDGSGQFYVFPQVTDTNSRVLKLFWDGLKTEFADNDQTSFDTLAVEAAAEYVKGRLAREVQNDLALYNSYFHPMTGSYTLKRKDCFLYAKERTRVSPL